MALRQGCCCSHRSAAAGAAEATLPAAQPQQAQRRHTRSNAARHSITAGIAGAALPTVQDAAVSQQLLKLLLVEAR